MFKWCPSCETVKPVAEFYESATARNGYSFRCRACTNKIVSGRLEAVKSKREVNPGEYICEACGQYKPLTEFKQLSFLGGRHLSTCNSCNSTLRGNNFHGNSI